LDTRSADAFLEFVTGSAMSLYTKFDHFNLPIGADHTPFEFLESVRDEAIDNDRPIGWSECHSGFWVVAGFPETQAILRDSESFSNRVVLWPQFKLPGAGKLMLGEYDPPEHTKYRRVVQPPLSPGKAAELVDHFRSDIKSLIDEFIEDGHTDLSEALTSQIGGRLTAMLCGLPPEQRAVYRSWVEAFTQTKFGIAPEAQATLREWRAAFEDMLRARRADPGQDVMSVIVHSLIDGRPMTDEESLDYFTILLLGSIENFHLFFSTILWRLGWDLELRRRLIGKPELVPSAVEEFVRDYASGGMSRIRRQRGHDRRCHDAPRPDSDDADELGPSRSPGLRQSRRLHPGPHAQPAHRNGPRDPSLPGRAGSGRHTGDHRRGVAADAGLRARSVSRTGLALRSDQWLRVGPGGVLACRPIHGRPVMAGLAPAGPADNRAVVAA
jgi:hypothetical protein